MKIKSDKWLFEHTKCDLRKDKWTGRENRKTTNFWLTVIMVPQR